MKPIFLSIENFMCHEKSVIDFSQFKSALIVGKISGNDLYSNGVGKTTIFKAIEYALFNTADVNLDKIVRDDCKYCKIIFDFEIDSEIYRVVRTRTKKGSSDLSLFKRISSEGEAEEILSGENSDKFWKDISGRRAADTEKDLVKLIKINSKSFRSTVHFAQNDFAGITTATPEKRKSLLKENLSLSFYSKIEKLAKDKFAEFSKKIEKNQTLIDSISSSEEEIFNLKNQILNFNQNLSLLLDDKKNNQQLTDQKKFEKNKINSCIENFIKESNSLKFQLEKNNSELEKIKTKSEELLNKKTLILSEAKLLANDLVEIKKEKEDLLQNNFEEIDFLLKEIEKNESELSDNKLSLSKTKDRIKHLLKPLPEGSECDHCRQPLLKDHIDNCKKEIEKELSSLRDHELSLENNNSLSLKEIEDKKQKLKKLTTSKNRLEVVNNQFLIKEEQIKDKKKYYTEYNKVIEEYNSQLEEKEKENSIIEEKIKLLPSASDVNLLQSLESLEKEIKDLISKDQLIDSQITSLNNKIAITNHSVEQSQENLKKKSNLILENKDLKEKSKAYPKVIEAFSSSGIPNLIIQNLLDELQQESNNLLNSLKPGLQIQFVTEKEKKDGSSDETLDILYFVQGKSREYEQLSGAMKLSVNFSLKLGMSFVLQKMFDTQINLLLLDEIDQALDKAGVDAFADIIKFFQKDFTILVITHNDRLKDKFKNIILVEQDKDMVSFAKVLNEK